MTVETAVERLPRGELESLQRTRLATLAARVYKRVPCYRRRFDAAVPPGTLPRSEGGKLCRVVDRRER